MKRIVQVAVIAIVAVTLLGADVDRARFERIGHQMVCTCGCNQILLECNHVGCPASDGMRKEVSSAISAGKSDSQVLATFVSKYGPTVLAAPTKSGFNLTAWIMPFLLFIVGLGLVMAIVRNWRFRPAVSTVVSPEAERYRERVRQETEL